MRVAIVGGGLGGLAAALLLRRAGVEASVYEQAAELREVGAGIVVSPNMVRPLRRMGLESALERIAVRLEAAWEFRRWQDGRVLFVQPMGEACERMYGAPCYVAHRADLHALLREALPAHCLHLCHRCSGVDQGGDEVRLEFEDPQGARVQVRADVAIGADGIHSTVRDAIFASAQPQFSGSCAFRCLVEREHAPEMAHRPVQTLWLGPGRHFVHYPISGGRLINVVAIVPAGDWRTESWTAEGKLEDLAAEFEGWDPRLRQLIAAARDTRRWALYDRAPLERWVHGRIALLGDAAHAMLPYFGQGAAQAIEDAEALAACLTGCAPASVPEALLQYERIRQPRASEVQRMSRGRELRNHLPDGPQQQARDEELARGDPLRQSAWLYGHEPGVAVQ
jgi:salicylate hydroxylase